METDGPARDEGAPERPGLPGRDRVRTHRRTSVPVGRIAGIPVDLHWTFAFLVALVVWAYWGSGARAVAVALLWVVGLFASVLVHETAHCLVGRRRGAKVDDILLLPIGGLSRMEHIPEAPEDELAIALVGPATSVVLGLALLGTALLAGARVLPPSLSSGSWLAVMGWLNLLLGAFNLLPALPMDGGRVLRALLARRRSRLEATVAAARIARGLAMAMIVVGVFYDVWLILIGLFVLMGARSEESQARRSDAVTRGGRTREPRT